MWKEKSCHLRIPDTNRFHFKRTQSRYTKQEIKPNSCDQNRDFSIKSLGNDCQEEIAVQASANVFSEHFILYKLFLHYGGPPNFWFCHQGFCYDYLMNCWDYIKSAWLPFGYRRSHVTINCMLLGCRQGSPHT